MRAPLAIAHQVRARLERACSVMARLASPRPPRSGRGSIESRDVGQVAGVEALIFGVLVFVLAMLAVANAWGVVEDKQAVASAAREAVRAFVQAPAGSNPDAEAQAAAQGAIEAAGRDPSRMRLAIEGSLSRCSRVVARVTYDVPLVAVPLIGGFGNSIVVSGRQSELVDPYRNGLGGDAQCAA